MYAICIDTEKEFKKNQKWNVSFLKKQKKKRFALCLQLFLLFTLYTDAVCCVCVSFHFTCIPHHSYMFMFIVALLSLLLDVCQFLFVLL